MAVTRTTNVFNPAVLVDVSHHNSLLYRITVRGLPDLSSWANSIQRFSILF
jgi:hypothetical protein